MTFPLIKPGGWAPNAPLTSDEINAFQANLVKALDGVNGGTFTLLAALIFAGADVRIAAILRILSGGQLVVDSGGNLTISAGAIQALAGALNVASGGAINVANGGDINVAAGGAINLATGATQVVDGIVSVPAGGAIHSSGQHTLHDSADINLEDSSRINLATGTELNANNGSLVKLNGTAVMTVASTALVTAALPERLNIDSAPFTARLSMIPYKADAGWVSDYDGRWTWTAAEGEAAMFSFPLRPGDSLLTVVVRIHGNATGGGSHGGSPPTEKPLVEVYRKDENGVSTLVGSQIDSVATGGAYDAAHDITVSFGPGHTPVTNNIYFVKVTAEGSPGTPGVPASTKVLSMKFTGLARSYRGTNEVYGC